MSGILKIAPTETLWAVTRDGRDVLLYPDGGWVFGKPAEPDLNPFTFRRTRWGFSPTEVQQSEQCELVKASEDGLLYKDRLSRFPCLIAYIFARGRLVRSKYNLLIEHTQANEYVADYEHLLGILQKKYGPPADTQKQWTDTRYKKDEEAWGRAILLGHLVMYDAWLTESTEISLMLRGEENRVFLEVEYSSRVLESLEEETTNTEELDLF